MKRILVPVDFSDAAINAYKYAISMGEDLNAEIGLLHVFHIPYIHSEMPADVYTKAIEEEKEESMAKMKALVKNISYPPEKISMDAELGFAVDEILRLSEDYDTVIMGTHGASNLTESIIGSVTSAVLEKSKIPVLAIPEAVNYNKPERILFASDLDKSEVEGLKRISDIAALFKAEVSALHVYDDELDRDKYRKLENAIEADPHINNVAFDFIQHDSVSEGINTYLQKYEHQIVVSWRRKRNLFESLFHKSMTKKLSFHSKKPLMVIHE